MATYAVDSAAVGANDGESKGRQPICGEGVKMAFEKYVLPDFDEPKMAAHLFRALIGEYIVAQKTKNEVLLAVEEHLGLTLTTDEKSDLQDLMTAVDGGSSPEEKRSIADEAYRVFIIAESGLTMYGTKSLLKARLSWV